jgi:hypothetical protein
MARIKDGMTLWMQGGALFSLLLLLVLSVS